MNNTTPLAEVLVTYRLNLEPATPPKTAVANATLRHIVANMNSGRACLLKAAAERALELTDGSIAGFSFELMRSGDLSLIWAAAAGVNAGRLRGDVPLHNSPCALVRRDRRAHLFSGPARHYRWIEAFGPVSELLVMPVMDGYGHVCGAFWLFIQDTAVKLGRKDVMHLQSLLDNLKDVMEVQRRSPMP